MLNLSDKDNYNPNLVWIKQIQDRFLCVKFEVLGPPLRMRFWLQPATVALVFKRFLIELECWNFGCRMGQLCPKMFSGLTTCNGFHHPQTVAWIIKVVWNSNTVMTYWFQIFLWKLVLVLLVITSEWSERSSYCQSYMGQLDETQTALKPLLK